MKTRAQSAMRDDPRRSEAGNPLQGPRLVARALLHRIHQEIAEDGRFRMIDLLAALRRSVDFPVLLPPSMLLKQDNAATAPI